MFKRITILFLFLSFGVRAQQALIPHYDSLTYHLYLNGSWKELTKEGHIAEKNHQQFYYLYYRMGAGYFNRKKYREAQKYFQKAYRYNHFDNWLNDWLYRTLIENEKYDEAFRLSRKFKDSTAIFFQVKSPSIINMISADAGIKTPSNYKYFKNMMFGDIGINHRLWKGISFFHNYSYLSQTGFFGKVEQQQYYVQANVPLTNTFALQPAFSIINQKISGAPETALDKSRYFTLESLKIIKSFPLFDVSIIPAISNIYDTITAYQLQATGGLTIHPLLNSRLKLSYDFIAQDNRPEIFLREAHRFSISVKPLSFLELKASYFTGNIIRLNEFNGYLINNSPDLLKSRITAEADLKVFSRLIIYFYYNIENRTQSYYEFNYSNQTFVTGFKLFI